MSILKRLDIFESCTFGEKIVFGIVIGVFVFVLAILIWVISIEVPKHVMNSLPSFEAVLTYECPEMKQYLLDNIERLSHIKVIKLFVQLDLTC